MFCQKCGGEAGSQPFCGFCGARLTFNTAESQPKHKPRYSLMQRTLLALAILLGLVVWHIVLSDSGQYAPQITPSASRVEAPETRKPSSDTREGMEPNTVSPPVASISSPPAVTDEVMSIDATSLLAAYQADEKAATARYENRKLAVTGVLSGVFIPPPSVLMRAGSDFHPSAFVTMGGPHPDSLEQTLFLPGIKAYSDSSSLFGERNPLVVAERLRRGETVTVVCTDPVASRVSDLVGGPSNGNTGYSVVMENCTLQDNTQSGDPNHQVTQASSPPETTVPSDQNNPVDAYQPCLEATQHLEVPDQIDLDLPHDFSSAEEPRPAFTFLFSEQGVDVYAVRTNKFGPAGYHRLALLVFQDEKFRRNVLRSYINSGLVTWAYSDTGGQDWKPIVNFKYVTLDFGWFQRKTGLEPSVSSTVFYAPPACDSVSEPAGARPSSMIGVYISTSPADLPHDSLRYRAAQALWKFQTREGSK